MIKKILLAAIGTVALTVSTASAQSKVEFLPEMLGTWCSYNSVGNAVMYKKGDCDKYFTDGGPESFIKISQNKIIFPEGECNITKMRDDYPAYKHQIKTDEDCYSESKNWKQEIAYGLVGDILIKSMIKSSPTKRNKK